MKIAEIITSLDVGGAEKQLLELCLGLKRENHDVIVGCIKKSGEMAQMFQSNGISVHLFKMKSPMDFSVYFRVLRWLKKQSPDIVHTHLFKADVFGGLAASSLGIPVICSKRNEDQYLKNPFYGWLARYVGNRCARIIAISEAVRSFLVNTARFESARIEVIPIGIVLKKPVERKRESSTINFGVVGRLAEQKGHEFLIRAFHNVRKSLSNIRLSIVGAGPLEERLNRLVNDLNLGDCVTFRGLVLDPDSIYEDLDVVVLPSLWEGAGNVVLESMIRGIPVIASNVGGIQEYLNGCGILIPSRDISALTNALLRMARDAALRKEFSESCVKTIASFDFQKTLRAHLECYSRFGRPIH